MDAEMQRLVDERIVAAVKAATDPLIAQITELKGSVGQVAEAGTKISEIQKNLKIVSDTVAAQKILGADDVKGLISAEMTASQKAAQEKAALPTATLWPATMPLAPRPGRDWKSVTASSGAALRNAEGKMPSLRAA